MSRQVRKPMLSIAVLLFVLPAIYLAAQIQNRILPDTYDRVATLVMSLTDIGSDVKYERFVPASDNLLDDKGYLLSVDGESINIYQYTNRHAAAETVARISPDGRTIQLPFPWNMLRRSDSVQFTWLPNIHFYQYDRLIIGETILAY